MGAMNGFLPHVLWFGLGVALALFGSLVIFPLWFSVLYPDALNSGLGQSYMASLILLSLPDLVLVTAVGAVAGASVRRDLLTKILLFSVAFHVSLWLLGSVNPFSMGWAVLIQTALCESVFLVLPVGVALGVRALNSRSPVEPERSGR